jgi:cellulase (glycosyl hydrolase family 5)
LALTSGGVILTFLLAGGFIGATSIGSYAYASTGDLTSSQPINGVVMKGASVILKQDNNSLTLPAPPNYINDSLKMISSAGLNHVRFVFYWEAYERDPEVFMKEIQSVANAADKYGLKIIYDNHQWHTSSWFDVRASGFPWSLFQNNSKYSRGGGGNTNDKSAQLFWADWWKRSVKDNHGRDGWTLMSEFLKKIVLAVDSHSSTLGYEILSEPHVNNKGQWSKIGKFNSFITTELRNLTSKTIVYSMNVPVDLNSPIEISPKNLAKMTPSNKNNTAFKVSVYALPDGDAYQKKRFNMFLKTRDRTGVPLYIGEWNNVVRTKQGGIDKLNPDLSELTKTDAKNILGALKKAAVWGTAFWRWDYQHVDTPSFNLVSDKNGKLVPTKYLGILKDIVGRVYGSSEIASTSNVTPLSSIQETSNEHPTKADTNNPAGYDNLNNLVHDIKNRVVDTKDIPLNAFQNSGAYQRADKQTQDCIDLAGKIGGKLEDQEISHCSEDANYFKDKFSNTHNILKADNTSN